MVGIEKQETTSIDLQNAKTDVEVRVDDASVSTLGAVFGTASFPPDMPEEIRTAILERAEQERVLAGEMVMGTPSTSLTLQAKAEKEEQTREEFAATWSVLERQQEIQKQHEAEWLQSSHTFAGQTLSGEDWEEMRKWFGDEENVAAWEDAMMAETGQSRDEVRRTGGKMKRFYDLMEKDKKGTLTQEERDEFKRLNEDRDVKRGADTQAKIQGIRSQAGYEQTAATDARQDADQQTVAPARRDLMGNEAASGGLAAAKNIAPEYQMAASGVQPATPPVRPAPSSPANTVQYTADNMFG